MSLSKEYKEYAEECMGWARTARSDRERAIFLQMSKTWMEAAIRGADRRCRHHLVLHSIAQRAATRQLNCVGWRPLPPQFSENFWSGRVGGSQKNFGEGWLCRGRYFRAAAGGVVEGGHFRRVGAGTVVARRSRCAAWLGLGRPLRSRQNVAHRFRVPRTAARRGDAAGIESVGNLMQ